MADKVGDYSRLDRFVHRLAFSSAFIQQTLAEIEDALFAKQLLGANDKNPVFVTSLPRAGTTILLLALSELPSLASHTYRDMPFVMSPLLWSKLSGSFRKDGAVKERAHGDGIQVGYDSPEAFEEILWRSTWPDKYSENGIDLWTEGDARSEASEYFRRHFAKIVLLRRESIKSTARYVSKNNANIARLDCIPHLFPDAKIVVPIRAPMEHAGSLLRQHLNFLEQHRANAFTKRYMRDIGHMEFGELHRPIIFPGLLESIADVSPTSLDYWLHYWIAAFTFVAKRRDRLIVVPHEVVCRDAPNTIARLLDELGIEESGLLDQVAAHFDPESARPRQHPKHTRTVRTQAEDLYSTFLVS